MSLCDTNIGGTYQIKNMSLVRAIEMRLKALGLVEHTSIQVLNKKRTGAVIFNVRGTRLAIGRDIACNIEVSEVMSNER